MHNIKIKNKEIEMRYSKVMAYVWEGRKRISCIILVLIAIIAAVISIIKYYRKKKNALKKLAESNSYISAHEEEINKLTGIK